MRRTQLLFRATWLPLLSWLVTTTPLTAAPRLAGLFVDNMVLQRDKPVPVWGWADPGEAIIITFAGQKQSATAGDDGKWMVSLPPMPANTNSQQLLVSSLIDSHQSSINNVLVGDVWICSGQSNMEWPVNRSADAANVIANSGNPQIRHFKIAHRQSLAPMEDVTSTWQEAGPETTAHFTAVGYHFARRLNRELGVPIGLIGCNWGGTRIEPWMPAIAFEMAPELTWHRKQLAAKDPATPEGKAHYEKALTEMRAWLADAETSVADGRHPDVPPNVISHNHQEPTRLFNAMVNPLIPYAIRGAIWYQGESNSGERDSYFHMQKTLIQSWRKLWDQGPFPFYFVQLTSFQRVLETPEGGDTWAWFREAQGRTLSVENTGMAVITDIGDATDIHPRNKQDVGARLAQWALAREYGRDMVPSGPLYRDHKVEGGTIRITFDYVGAGLIVGLKDGLKPTQEVKDGKLAQFAIAGADRQWHWAEARIDGDTVVASSPAVAEPVAVRYAFRSNPEGANLYNREGLPASPFRTDDW